MPKPASSVSESDVTDDPGRLLGTRINISIIAHLRRTPFDSTASIATALSVPRPTIVKAIERLLDLDLLIADPPRHIATRGQRVHYRVNDQAITELYLQLGQVMEEL